MNISAILTIAGEVLSLLPLLAETVKRIEDILPAGTPGTVKLEAVRGIIQNCYAAGNAVETEFNQVWPTLQSVIGSLVHAFNASGVFTKATPAA